MSVARRTVAYGDVVKNTVPVVLYSALASGRGASGPGVAAAYGDTTIWNTLAPDAVLAVPSATTWRIRILVNNLPTPDPSLALKYGDRFLIESVETPGRFLAANNGGNTASGTCTARGWAESGGTTLFVRTLPASDSPQAPWYVWRFQKCSGNANDDYVHIGTDAMNLVSSNGAAVAFGADPNGPARSLCAIGGVNCSTTRPADVTKVLKVLPPDASESWTAPVITCAGGGIQIFDYCATSGLKPRGKAIKWWVWLLAGGGILLLIGLIALVIWLSIRYSKKKSMQSLP